ncbi:MAG TPA: transketolase [Acidobacteriota bacterium]|nr:transketolase [Acidobacteriota bacterium]
MPTTEPAPTVGAVDTLAVNTIRMLAAEAVQRANSGHPGMPMGAAPMAYVLWTRHLRHNPRNPDWPNRDRFVLSAGHASMLLYALLHLTGYELSIEELKRFRQWGSATPGHPEYGDTPGVETTTGPLGQGFANAVGMALAEARLAAEFNRDTHRPVDHHTFVIASDGDMMEGVQAEAASLAGHLGLGKLVVLYDDNKITIEGSTALAFSEDVPARYAACGWHTQTVADGNDLDAIDVAIQDAKAETDRPSLIAVETRIGFGSPNRENTSKAHGEPLGEDELALTKRQLGWPAEPPFYVADDVAAHFRQAVAEGESQEVAWRGDMEQYAEAHPQLAAELDRRTRGELPPDWDARLPSFESSDGPMATRAASGKVLNALAGALPELIGGSADLAGSNKTLLDGHDDFGRGAFEGRNLRFGVREHAMGAMMNGMALHRGLRPYGGTFLIFCDYMRPAVRLAALMKQPTIYVYTHDSVGVGEDGPTHQPIEQLASLRAIPGLVVLRPGDANETREAWAAAIEEQGPVAIALTRQKLPVLETDAEPRAARRGAYVLADAGSDSDPEIILIASGSELQLAVAAYDRLCGDGIAARVVSMPSWELFERQESEYRDAVLPPGVRNRLVVEAGATFGWRRYAGDRGRVIGIDRFGASAPSPVNMKEFGFTADNVEAIARAYLEHA